MNVGMMSVRSKSKKLTTSTTSIGRPKNSASTITMGAVWNHDAASPESSGAASLTTGPEAASDCSSSAAGSMMAMSRRHKSGRYEFVPAPGQVAVFVHHRVPAGDVAHAVPDAAAVTRGTFLLHQGAVRVLDVDRRGLALVPVVPFVLGQEFLGGRRHRRIIALLSDEAALP